MRLTLHRLWPLLKAQRAHERDNGSITVAYLHMFVNKHFTDKLAFISIIYYWYIPRISRVFCTSRNLANLSVMRWFMCSSHFSRGSRLSVIFVFQSTGASRLVCGGNSIYYSMTTILQMPRASFYASFRLNSFTCCRWVPFGGGENGPTILNTIKSRPCKLYQ